jgi:hypothetical protein
MASGLGPWRRPVLKELSGALEDTPGGIVILGTEDVNANPVRVDLSARSLLIIGNDRTARSAAAKMVASQLCDQFPGRITAVARHIAAGDPLLFAWPADEVGKIRDELKSRYAHDVVTKLMSSGALCIEGRLVLLIDDGDIYGSDASLIAAVTELFQAGLVSVIWTSTAQAARGGIPNLLRSDIDTFFLRPNARADVSEGSVVTGTPLEHRPRARYKPGQGIFQADGRQQYVWLPVEADQLVVSDGRAPDVAT